VQREKRALQGLRLQNENGWDVGPSREKLYSISKWPV